MFKVLRATYWPTGQTTEIPGGPPIHWQRVNWRCIGEARDMQEAIAKYGGRPVLEWIGEQPVHYVQEGAPERRGK
jgi:hypothetical protein